MSESELERVLRNSQDDLHYLQTEGWRIFPPGEEGNRRMAMALRAEGYNVLPVDSKEPLSDFERAVRLLTCGVAEKWDIRRLLGWDRPNGQRTRALNALANRGRPHGIAKKRAEELSDLEGVSDYSLVWVLCTLVKDHDLKIIKNFGGGSLDELRAGLAALGIPVPLPVDHPAAAEAIRRLRTGERPR